MSKSDRGRSRAKGRSTAEVLRSDRCDAPAPLLEESYEFLGDEDVSIDRYVSRAYFDREIERLWPRVWQWACREEHLREVGDTYVYDIGPYSIIVVRSAADSIEAFLNSCTHRGTRILASEGSGYSENFTCPFHGWCWNIDGSLKEIPCEWDFEYLEGTDQSLPEVKVGRWGRFVFINPDPDCEPLEDFVGDLDDHFTVLPYEQRYKEAHVAKIIPTNWKSPC